MNLDYSFVSGLRGPVLDKINTMTPAERAAVTDFDGVIGTLLLYNLAQKKWETPTGDQLQAMRDSQNYANLFVRLGTDLEPVQGVNNTQAQSTAMFDLVTSSAYAPALGGLGKWLLPAAVVAAVAFFFLGRKRRRGRRRR